MTDRLRDGAVEEELLESLRTALIERQPDDRPALAVMQAFEEFEKALRGEAPLEGGDYGHRATDVLREVAHMVQAPLGSIMMLTEVMREGTAAPSVERRERQLAIIYMAALGLSNLAGDLLVLVDGPPRNGPTEQFSVKETLEFVADIVRPVAEVHECELLVDSPEGPHRLGPLLGLKRGLVRLALAATLRVREGTILLQARFDGPEHVTFSLTARGSDLSAGRPEHPFEIFRPDPGDGSYTLSADGIGLTASAQSIMSLGSRLEVEEESDGGLRLAFRARLPEVLNGDPPVSPVIPA